ncbi:MULTISPECIES: restriction endonuclease subunit S [Bifidobacterium]|uniref:restriction endonuclease subunit S n=1 Tax=Bifidobacterium TaxID=1678 RepID=UPI0030842443
MKLGEIAELKTGPFGTQFSASEYVAEGIPMINVGDIGYGEVNTHSLKMVSKATIRRLSEHLVREGDIVFGRKGSVDRHAYIDKQKDGWLQGSDCIRVRCNSSVNSRYISHFLRLSYARKQMLSSCVGSTMPSLNTDILQDMTILLPDRATQDRIEGLLSSVDEKIETNAKIIAELESVARSVYDYWFTQFDFPDEHGNPYRFSGGAMTYSEALHRDIPEGWKVITANELVSIDRGISYTANELADQGTSLINLASFNTDGTYKHSGLKHFTGVVKDTKLLSPDDLVMCVTQQTPIDSTGSTDVIAKTFLVPNIFKDKVTMSMDVVRLVENREGMRYLLNQMLSRVDYHRYVSGYASGTKIKHLDVEGSLSFPIALPQNNGLIDAYASLCKSGAAQISVCLKESARLAALRDRLLPLLMNGQAVIE